MTTLKQIQQNQLQKEVVINDNFSTVAPAGIFGFKGNLNGLLYNYYGGIYVDSNGKPLEIADGSVTLGNNAKNYICFNPTTSKVEVSQLALADGVVPIAEVTVTNSVITAIKDTRMHKYIALGDTGGGGSTYTLPIASDKTLGGIKVGKNLTINPDGTLDASGGGGGGLTYLSEIYTTTAPFLTTFPCISLSPNSVAEGEDTASTDVSVALCPKGNGSFSLSTPDNTAAGGNKRGYNSIDLQCKRVYATEIASAQNSFVAGYRNTATAISSIALGEINTSTGQYAVSIGYSNQSTGIGSVVLGCSNKASNYYSLCLGTNNNTQGSNCAIISGEYNAIDANGKYSVIIGGAYAQNKAFAGGYYFGSSIRMGSGSNQQSKYILNYYESIASTKNKILTSNMGASATANNIITCTNNETKRIKGSVLITEYATTPTGGTCASYDVDFILQRLATASTTKFLGTPKIDKIFSSTEADTNGIDLQLNLNTTLGGVEVTVVNTGGPALKICAVLDSIDIIMNNN